MKSKIASLILGLTFNLVMALSPCLSQTTYWHSTTVNTGVPGAEPVGEISTAVAFGPFMLSASNEDQILRYHRRVPNVGAGTGTANRNPALWTFPLPSGPGTNFPVVNTGGEIDIESSARVGNRVYFCTSHSNGPSGGTRLGFRYFFAVDVAFSGDGTQGTNAAPNTPAVAFVGAYTGLRTDLIAWDVNNTHGLGANHFQFAASSASGGGAGIPAERLFGFNIEGLAISPAGVAYLGFRAPLVPAVGAAAGAPFPPDANTDPSRTHALIVPLLNFRELVDPAVPAPKTAVFGHPIRLDLGGRGIRSMEFAGGACVISTGPANDPVADADNFKIFRWYLDSGEAPRETLAAVPAGFGAEAIVADPTEFVPTLGNSTASTNITLLEDQGAAGWFRSLTTPMPLDAPFLSLWGFVPSAGTPQTTLRLRGRPNTVYTLERADTTMVAGVPVRAVTTLGLGATPVAAGGALTTAMNVVDNTAFGSAGSRIFRVTRAVGLGYTSHSNPVGFVRYAIPAGVESRTIISCPFKQFEHSGYYGNEPTVRNSGWISSSFYGINSGSAAYCELYRVPEKGRFQLVTEYLQAGYEGGAAFLWEDPYMVINPGNEFLFQVYNGSPVLFSAGQLLEGPIDSGPQPGYSLICNSFTQAATVGNIQTESGFPLRDGDVVNVPTPMGFSPSYRKGYSSPWTPSVPPAVLLGHGYLCYRPHPAAR